MIKIYGTLQEARSVRATLPNVVDGFAYANYVRKTLDGKFAVISIPKDCWLSQETIRRYNLPASTLGWLDDGEPDAE